MSELRMTYQSQFGDYGWAEPFDLNSRHRIANRLGAYEDIGTPEQFRALRDRFMAEQAEAPLPMDLHEGLPFELTQRELGEAQDMEAWLK